MRNKVKKVSPENALANVLDALVNELLDVTDEEVLGTAQELKMNLSLKESAAFAGLLYPEHPKVGDFFDVESRSALPSSDRKIRSTLH